MAGLRHTRLVFARELLDLRRERRVFRRLFLQPLVFVLVIAAPAMLVQRAEARDRTTNFDVAVEGNIDAVPGLREGLDAKPFTLVQSPDAARAVTNRSAEVGIVVREHEFAGTLSSDPVEVDVLSFSTQDVSERARPMLVRRLTEIADAAAERLLDDAGADPKLASPIKVTVDDVATTSTEGVRFGLAQALPALLVIQLFGLVSMTQERVVGAKDKRVLEALLVLPVRRIHLLLGVGAAAIVVGALSSVVVFVPLTVGVSAAVASLSRSLAAPASVATALGLGAATLAIGFAAIGLALGARAASGSEGSVFVSLVQLTVMATVVITPFLSEVEARGPLLAVPVLGPMLFVRDGVSSGAPLQTITTLLAGQLGVAVVLLRVAARMLDRDRMVLRATR